MTDRVLTTERLLLRPVSPGDLEPMTSLISDFRVSQYLSRVPHPYTLEDGRWFLDFAPKSDAEGSTIHRVIAAGADGAFLGVMALNGIDDAADGEIGYWLGHKYWGKGYGTEALAPMIDLVFEAKPVARLVAHVIKENIGSVRVVEKNGFRHAGRDEMDRPVQGDRMIFERYELAREDRISRG
ncbi:MAG: GNAT family N-acetyltransferase [Rhodospirillaceae bacterium]|jgi:RimJ/RimL family protein N-acetyltransferase|nr:GNAT family N-acetyltransferase [Rhodospirillaceae bacterium]MBT6136291.1 GNAT family N-acetyltransferase [Rhodospirillaceae bacterium]